ncbi:hypothetical protein QS460_04015 [Liquorilactobacillus mali]|uniref:hypothetical protein n=1 Tax=Liquorilactobacillus mali TaxID=1618 RepID=UPI00264DC478|nr:hypothetical protein [Liquorilactobacillus mali]MDN7145092.1 hypothetical protein [Liquorilactobacillus mali]
MKYFKQFFIISLGISLMIGIISNLFYPQNLSETLIVIALSLGIGFCLPKFACWANSLSKSRVSLIIYLVMGLILVIQLLILIFFPATVYHDPFRVLHEAELLSHNHPDWDNSTYFWRYSNNIPLAYFLSLWLKLTNVFQISTNAALHILSLLFLDGFIILSLRTCLNFVKSHTQVLALALFFLLGPFAYTYYLQVFYSDLPILLILLLTFNLLARWPKSKKAQLVSAIFLFLIIVCGQLIKANLIILSVAILILIIDLFMYKKQILRKMIVPLAVILFAFAATFPASQAVSAAASFKSNSRYQFPLTHWIWMSYNPVSHGTYDGSDVGKMISLPSKASRQSYIAKALPERLSRLGINGILRQWVARIGILLSVNDIQSAYTGGFIQVPRVYVNWQSKVHVLSQAIMRSGFIWIYLITLSKCLELLKRQTALDSIRELAIITAVGYVFFHMLLWESESRYGQALLPLLLVINTLPIQEAKIQKVQEIQGRLGSSLRTKLGPLVVCLIVVLSNLVNWHGSAGQIIAAQRSQLSLQYHAKETWIEPGKVVSQQMVIKHEATLFSVAVPQGSKLSGELINYRTKRHYLLKHGLKAGSSSLSYHGKIAAGSYQIFLVNKDSQMQPIEIVQTVNYQLAPYPVKMNAQTVRFASLVYKATYSNRKV